jgi:hypothetical protein
MSRIVPCCHQASPAPDLLLIGLTYKAHAQLTQEAKVAHQITWAAAVHQADTDTGDSNTLSTLKQKDLAQKSSINSLEDGAEFRGQVLLQTQP